MSLRTIKMIPMTVMLAFALAGCDKAGDKGGGTKEKPTQMATKNEETKHSGWWCDEHGIPEAECSMCSPKVAAECKKKGDWCDKHDRAKSQCFICDPKLKEKYAARYRAKYGKEPPPIEEEKP
jgi:hypothetical protein